MEGFAINNDWSQQFYGGTMPEFVYKPSMKKYEFNMIRDLTKNQRKHNVRILNPDWIVNLKRSLPNKIKSDLLDSHEDINSLSYYGKYIRLSEAPVCSVGGKSYFTFAEGIAACHEGGEVWCLPSIKTNKFKKFLTKVKTMFFSKKDPHLLPQHLKYRIDGLVEYQRIETKELNDLRDRLQSLEEKNAQLQQIVESTKRSTSVLGKIVAHGTQYVVTNSTYNSPKNMKTDGYEYAGAAEEGLEVWIKEKRKSESKSNKKVKSKKKR